MPDPVEGDLSQLGRHFAALSDVLQDPDIRGLRPQRVIEAAVRATPAAEQVGLTLVERGRRPRTVAATGPLVQQVDAIQYGADEGPCLDATSTRTLVSSADLARDGRYPVFGPQCVERTGVRSMLSVQLHLGAGDLAAMNFYSTRTDAFGAEDEIAAALFAPFASMALNADLREQQAEHLTVALGSSRQIGVALGILMARELLTQEQAFAVLSEASQRLNRKLRDVAEAVERTGEVPGVQAPPHG